MTIIAATISTPAFAWTLKATPSLAVEESWDTNIFNSPAGETEDFVTRVTPRLTLTLEAFRTAVNLSGGGEGEWFAEHSELNKGGAAKMIDLTVTDPLRATPRLSFRPSARFAETRDSARRIALTTADPSLPPAEILITERTGLREYSGSLQMTYLASPTVDLGLGGGGARRDYFEGAPGLVDSRSITGTASAAWRATPLLSAGMFFEASRHSHDDRPASQSYSAGLSGTYAITGRYRAEGRAGASQLVERTSPGEGGATSRSWFPNARLSVTYSLQSLVASLGLSYEVAGAGSFGRATRRGTSTLSISHQFSRDWGWDLAATGQVNRSAEDPVTEDVLTLSGTAGVRYAATRWAWLRAGATAVSQKSNAVSGTDIERYSLFIGVTVGNTYLVI